MSPGLCSKRSAAAAPPVVIHRRDADVYGEKRRREEAERRARAGARGPGPPPAPRAVAAPLRRRIVRCLPRRRPRRAPLLRRRGGERRRERERERGARRHMELRGAGGRRLRRPRNAVPGGPYAVTARQPHRAPRDPFCGVGGGAARPDPPPGAGRAAGAAAGRCARVLRDGEGRCAEMGTVWDTGTVRRDGDSAQHGDSVQRWAPRAPQPGALPGMSAPGGARSAGAHRALRAITLRCVPRAAAPLCCRPVPSPRAITLVRVKTAPLRVENPAGLRSHSDWTGRQAAGRSAATIREVDGEGEIRR